MNLFAVLMCFSLVLLAALPVLLHFRRSPFRVLAIAALLAGVFAAGLAAFSRTAPPDTELKISLPRQVVGKEFVSSETCRSCHPGEHASWHATYHRTMTQVATPETVLASFDDVELESRGRKYRLWRKGDEFWVRMADPDWELRYLSQGGDLGSVTDPPMVERRVVLTTGSHHLQGYWVPREYGNGLHHLPWEWHIAEKRWIPFEDAHVSPPESGRNFGHWNSTCIKCHSTNGIPRLDVATGTMLSTVAEFGISCEACHGPGAEHVEHHRNPLNRYRQHLRPDDEGDPTIVNPARQSSKTSTEICGQCHSTFVPADYKHYLTHGESYRAGGDLFRTYRILSFEKPDAENGIDPEKFYWGEQDAHDGFWRDGTARVGGREYLGLLASGCYLRGELSCLSCHSMHDSDPRGQVAAEMDGNRACLGCHTEYADRVEEHTRHPLGSSGSLCYNCHMPHTSYALFRAIRSHRIDSPNAAVSAATGRPNACNLCHLDQTLQWTAAHLNAWYGTPLPDHDVGRALLPVEQAALLDDDHETAASLLWLLKGDAAQRAVAAWHMGWPPAQAVAGKHWQAPFLAELLNDPYSAVRFVAFQSLQTLPGFHDHRYDFVGPPEQRSESSRKAVDAWNRGRASRPLPSKPEAQAKGHNAALLIGPDGTLQQDAIDRLIEQRDDRPVTISE